MYKKILFITGVIFLFTCQKAFAGGCSSNIEGDYEIRNFQCLNNCNDLAVINENRTDIDQTEYFFLSDEKCETCNEVYFFVGTGLGTNGNYNALSLQITAHIGDHEYSYNFREDEGYFEGNNEEQIDVVIGRYEFQVIIFREPRDVQIACKGECPNLKAYWQKYEDEVLINTCPDSSTCRQLYVQHDKIGYCPSEELYGGYSVMFSKDLSLENFVNVASLVEQNLDKYKHIKYKVDGSEFEFDLIRTDMTEIPQEKNYYLIVIIVLVSLVTTVFLIKNKKF